jgi:hypothetical protein
MPAKYVSTRRRQEEKQCGLTGKQAGKKATSK